MRKKLVNIITVGVMLAMILGAFSGCGSKTTADKNEKAAGTMLLSVNPEIEIEYDSKGMVLDIEGINDDGKQICESYTQYEGKDCRTVVNDLVQAIYDKKYFENTVEGHTKNIIIKLEKDSICPDDTFMDDVRSGVQDVVKNCGISSKVIVVNEDDLDDKGYINTEKAKRLVMEQFGVKEIAFNEHSYDLDDGIYEMEFSVNGVKYEYEVDARTGKILKADIDGNDDWDDMDDWDDWKDEKLNDDDDDDDDDRDNNKQPVSSKPQNSKDDDDDDDDDDRDNNKQPVSSNHQSSKNDDDDDNNDNDDDNDDDDDDDDEQDD